MIPNGNLIVQIIRENSKLQQRKPQFVGSGYICVDLKANTIEVHLNSRMQTGISQLRQLKYLR